jgi:TolB-like protein/Tfp pilus assembly protein PilF
VHHVFGDFTLYPDRAELVGPAGLVQLEPKAFAVLCLLVENHDRVVTRDEMIAAIWGGRFVSDAAVATAVKFARKAVGDDGDRQAMIRTAHGLGHRFVAQVQRRVDASTVVQPEQVVDRAGQRPTIAVLPLAQTAEGLQVGDGLADEIIASLSRLRWLRVIARESSFRFRHDGVDLDAIRRVLGAGYALTGRVELSGARLSVAVTLIDTGTGAVVWADRFSPDLDGLHEARQDIVDAVVGALDLQIPQAEAMAARGKPTEALDAWGAYHLGMSHLHRYNAHDNAIAKALLERATKLDPGFAVAYAARAFARFQDGVQWFGGDRAKAQDDVRSLAERAFELDPLDPFANMVMGRWHWLAGNPDDGLDWYDRAIQLSPSYSKGHYTRGMIDAFAGRAERARAGVDIALRLSPLDPMMGPMLTARAISYLAEGEYATARDWALKAARHSPTHANLLCVAAAACELAGDHAKARHFADTLRRAVPEITVSMYLQSVPTSRLDVHARIREALRRVGIPAAG